MNRLELSDTVNSNLKKKEKSPPNTNDDKKIKN
jgi:hypothetical protein